MGPGQCGSRTEATDLRSVASSGSERPQKLKDRITPYAKLSIRKKYISEYE